MLLLLMEQQQHPSRVRVLCLGRSVWVGRRSWRVSVLLLVLLRVLLLLLLLLLLHICSSSLLQRPHRPRLLRVFHYVPHWKREGRSLLRISRRERLPWQQLLLQVQLLLLQLLLLHLLLLLLQPLLLHLDLVLVLQTLELLRGVLQLQASVFLHLRRRLLLLHTAAVLLLLLLLLRF